MSNQCLMDYKINQFNSKKQDKNKSNGKEIINSENKKYLFNDKGNINLNNEDNIYEIINENKIEKYDSSEQLDKKDNSHENLDSSEWNEFKMDYIKKKSSSNYINENNKFYIDKNKNENSFKNSVNYNQINNNDNFIDLNKIKISNELIERNIYINNKNYIKLNNKERENNQLYENEKNDYDGKENVTDDEEDNDKEEYLKYFGEKKTTQNIFNEENDNINVNYKTEILNEDNNCISNNNKPIIIKNMSIKLLKEYSIKENKDNEKQYNNNIKNENDIIFKNENIEKNNIIESKINKTNHEYNEFLSSSEKFNNYNRNIDGSENKNSLINSFDNNSNNIIYNEANNTYSTNYINIINTNKMKKKLYSSNTQIKQNKKPIKPEIGIKSKELSKSCSFSHDVNENNEKFLKKNKNIEKNISINKKNIISHNINYKNLNKKISIIINKYSIGEFFTIINIIQFLYELKIINKLIKKNQNIDLDINKIKLNIEKITEKDIKQKEELEFIEQLWLKINPSMNEYINSKLFIELLNILFSYNNNYINNNKIKELVILIENLLYKYKINNNKNPDNNKQFLSPLRNITYEINDLWPIQKLIKSFIKLKNNIKYNKSNKSNNYGNKNEESYNNNNLIKEKKLEQDKYIYEKSGYSFETPFKPNKGDIYEDSLILNKKKKNTVYERLYNLRKINNENKSKSNSKMEDFNFKPIYISNDERMNKSFTNYNKERMPKGYYDYIIRNRALINKRESENKLNEDKMYGKNYEKIKKMEIKQFNITDLKENKNNNKNNNIKKKKNKKIIDNIYITIEIKIQNGVKTFKIYKNDNNLIEQLNEFCEKYEINENDKKLLFDKIMLYKEKFFGHI